MPELDITSANILAFIRQYTAQHGVPPFVYEICEAVGKYRRSPVVYSRLRLLRQHKLIKRLPGQKRCWVLPDYAVEPLGDKSHPVVNNRAKRAQWLRMIAGQNLP